MERSARSDILIHRLKISDLREGHFSFIGAVFENSKEGLSLHPLGVQFVRSLPMFRRSFIDGLHHGPGAG